MYRCLRWLDQKPWEFIWTFGGRLRSTMNLSVVGPSQVVQDFAHQPLGDGARLHGWLTPDPSETNTWQATLAMLFAGK